MVLAYCLGYELHCTALHCTALHCTALPCPGGRKKQTREEVLSIKHAIHLSHQNSPKFYFFLSYVFAMLKNNFLFSVERIQMINKYKTHTFVGYSNEPSTSL